MSPRNESAGSRSSWSMLDVQGTLVLSATDDRLRWCSPSLFLCAYFFHVPARTEATVQTHAAIVGAKLGLASGVSVEFLVVHPVSPPDRGVPSAVRDEDPDVARLEETTPPAGVDHLSIVAQCIPRTGDPRAIPRSPRHQRQQLGHGVASWRPTPKARDGLLSDRVNTREAFRKVARCVVRVWDTDYMARDRPIIYPLDLLDEMCP